MTRDFVASYLGPRVDKKKEQIIKNLASLGSWSDSKKPRNESSAASF